MLGEGGRDAQLPPTGLLLLSNRQRPAQSSLRLTSPAQRQEDLAPRHLDSGRMVRRLGGYDLGDRSRRCKGKSAVYPRTERRNSRRPGLLGRRKAYYDPAKVTVPTLL